MINNTIKFDQSEVTLTFNENTIYLNIIPYGRPYRCYERYIMRGDTIPLSIISTDIGLGCCGYLDQSIHDPNNIKSLITIAEIHHIMNNSFKKIQGYSVKITTNNNGIMKLVFSYTFTIFIDITFEIMLHNNMPLSLTTNVMDNMNTDIITSGVSHRNLVSDFENSGSLFNWNICGWHFNTYNNANAKIKLD